MSSPPPGVWLDAFNFTGGYPRKEDLVPSIIFAVAYGIAIPVLIYRIIDPASRTWLLLRPAVFAGLRLSMYITRAIMSVVNYNVHTLAGENAMNSISFALLLFPLLDLWRRHVLTTLPKPNHPKWITPFTLFGYVCILTSICLSIAVAAKINPRSYKDYMTRALWRAMYVTALGTAFTCVTALTITHFVFKLRVKETCYLMVAMLLSLLVCCYRVVQIFTQDENAPIRSRASYYTLEAMCDFIVFCMLVGINLRKWYPGERIREPRIKPGAIAKVGMVAEAVEHKLHPHHDNNHNNKHKTKMPEADRFV